MKNNQKIEAPTRDANEGLTTRTCSASPSDFLNLDFPSCSIFGETWHEMAAVTYLEALLAEGDKWQKLTPEQVAEAMKKVKNPRGGCALGSILLDHKRMNAVSSRLTSAEDARNFSWAWRRTPNEKS